MASESADTARVQAMGSAGGCNWSYPALKRKCECACATARMCILVAPWRCRWQLEMSLHFNNRRHNLSQP
jgi:hypothetical protein